MIQAVIPIYWPHRFRFSDAKKTRWKVHCVCMTFSAITFYVGCRDGGRWAGISAVCTGPRKQRFTSVVKCGKKCFNFRGKKKQGGGVKALKSPCLTMKNDLLILISNLAPKCFSSLRCNFTPYWFLLAVRLTATTLFSSKSTSTLAPIKFFIYNHTF